MMPSLRLDTLHINPYRANSACAYIYPESSNKPLDHKGNPIGIFAKDPHEHAEYLQRNLLPKIDNALKNTSYFSTGIEFINQAPHPFFAIQHRNGRVLSSEDLNNIKRELHRALHRINDAMHAQSKIVAKKIQQEQTTALHYHIQGSANSQSTLFAKEIKTETIHRPVTRSMTHR